MAYSFGDRQYESYITNVCINKYSLSFYTYILFSFKYSTFVNSISSPALKHPKKKISEKCISSGSHSLSLYLVYMYKILKSSDVLNQLWQVYAHTAYNLCVYANFHSSSTGNPFIRPAECCDSSVKKRKTSFKNCAYTHIHTQTHVPPLKSDYHKCNFSIQDYISLHNKIRSQNSLCVEKIIARIRFGTKIRVVEMRNGILHVPIGRVREGLLRNVRLVQLKHVKKCLFIFTT